MDHPPMYLGKLPGFEETLREIADAAVDTIAKAVAERIDVNGELPRTEIVRIAIPVLTERANANHIQILELICENEGIDDCYVSRPFKIGETSLQKESADIYNVIFRSPDTEDYVRVDGRNLHIGNVSWNMDTWERAVPGDADEEDVSYVKLKMKVVSTTGLADENGTVAAELRRNFRQMVSQFLFDTANLPSPLREVLNGTHDEGIRFTLPFVWTRQYVPQDMARRYQDLYNAIAEFPDQAGYFVVELYREGKEDTFDRVASVKLIPRGPVYGVCVFEYLVEVLHIDTP